MKHLRKTLVALGATACLVGACSAPAGYTGASKREGDANSLIIACSQQEDFCQQMTKSFSRATGISATYVRLGAGEVIARMQTTQGEFDVWSGGQAENHIIADQKGFIERYQSPNAADLPAEYNDAEGVWSGFYTDSIAFCYNKTELDRLGAKVPESWEDLLQPELKGRIVMPHPATAGVGYMVIWTIRQVQGDTDKAFEYLQQLDENILQYSKSSATSTEMAGRGEIAVGIALDSDCAKAYDTGYEALQYSYPSEGTGYEVGAVSVLKGAANLEGAKKYMDWILSKEAQDLYGDVPSFAAPIRADAILGEGVPAQDSIKRVKWDQAEVAEQRESLLKLFNQRIASADSVS